MKPLLIIGLWSMAALANAHAKDSDLHCYPLFGQLRCDFYMETRPPIGGPPPAASEGQCRDAAGKLTACPAVAPKPCQNPSDKSAKCGTSKPKPA